MANNEKVDVLIIGSGASGAAVAWSLAETKMRILCLEQGDWMKQSDYPSNGRDYEARLFSDYATLKFGVVVVAATLAWAFLKTGWELGTFHYKRLCTFVGALRKFCRDYWGKAAAV